MSFGPAGAVRGTESHPARPEIPTTADLRGEAGETIPGPEGAVGETGSRPARPENIDASDRSGESGKAAPSTAGTGGGRENSTGASAASAKSEREGGKMDSEPWQQILLALERQRAENAERDAARTRENAERDAARARENAERDTARAKEMSMLRADFDKLRVENANHRAENAETAKALIKEIADLRAETANARVETARGFQHMAMWFVGVLIGLAAAAITVAVQLNDKLPPSGPTF